MGWMSAASAAERDNKYDEYNYDFSSPFNLSGKTALVAGLSGGIGRAICLALVRAGADVVVHDNSKREGSLSTLREINRQYRDVLKGGEKQPSRCLGMVCANFRDPHAVDEMFRAVVQGISVSTAARTRTRTRMRMTTMARCSTHCVPLSPPPQSLGRLCR